jgi:hypothetical protein
MKTFRKKIKNSKTRSKKQSSTKIGGNRTGNGTVFLFNTLNKISMEPNKDPSYIEKGIIHTTTVGAINIVRGFASGLANIVGSSGFDNTIYDQKRDEALSNLQKSLAANQKICNLKIEIDSGVEVFFIHSYGSLYEKSQQNQ